MNKLIERIGTQPQKFSFMFTLTSIKTKASTKHCYRVCLRREDKTFYSSYFKPEPNQLNQIKETIKFSATMFYNKKELEYQTKMFELILLRCEKHNQIEESKHQIDLQQVIINYQITKVFQDRFSIMQADISGEGVKESLSPIRKSCPQPQQKSYNTISNIQKNLIKDRMKDATKQQTIDIIRFDDDIVETEGPIRNTIDAIKTGLISSSKQKQVSFRNVKVTQDENLSKQKERRRERRKSRENINNMQKNNTISTLTNMASFASTPNNKTIIPSPNSFQTNLQQKLDSIQNQLGQERLRKSTFYENINNQKDQMINKLKNENSHINTSLNKYMNDLQFSNRSIKNLQERYQNLYKKMTKVLQQNRQNKQQKQRLASENAELLSTISILKSNNTIMVNNNRNFKQTKNQIDSKKHLQIQKLTKQIDKYKKSNKRLDEEVQALEGEKLLIENKYEQILKKYKITSGQLSSERMKIEELKRKIEGQDRQHITQLKRRQQQIIQMKRNRKQLQVRLLKPGDELTKKQHELLKQKMQRMQLKISQDTKQNRDLQLFLKKEIEKYKKQNMMLYQKMNMIEKSYNDEINIMVNREKSLNKALLEKDKKIAQQSKQLTKIKQILAQNNKFIQSQKVDLIMKMRVLNEELTKRKEVSQELELSQYKNRQLTHKIKMLSSQKEENTIQLQRLRQQLNLSQNKTKDHHSALSLVQQLQGEIVKVNMKMARTMQMVFQNDPGLAQNIIQNLRQS